MSNDGSWVPTFLTDEQIRILKEYLPKEHSIQSSKKKLTALYFSDFDNKEREKIMRLVDCLGGEVIWLTGST